LDDVLSAEPPNASVTGIYFGLFNPQYDDEGPVADIYVAGGIYGDDDWLPAVKKHWWPNGRYARSQLLAQLYRIAYESPSSLGNNAEYPLVLGFGVLAAKHLCLAIKSKLSARAAEAGGSPSGLIAAMSSRWASSRQVGWLCLYVVGERTLPPVARRGCARESVASDATIRCLRRVGEGSVPLL
jgi:hypothetical protein